MTPLVPGLSPDSFEILARLLADPEAVKARLAELEAAVQKANDADAALDAKRATIEAAETEAKTVIDQAAVERADLKRTYADTKNLEARIAEREQALIAAEAESAEAIATQTSALEAAQADLTQRERQLDASKQAFFIERGRVEADLQARDAAMQEREAAVARTEADLKRRLEAIRAAAA